MYCVQFCVCLFATVVLFVFFFFSSRRRHTRLQGDWSSDVCSSDLRWSRRERPHSNAPRVDRTRRHRPAVPARSEEHTSELQSPCNLVCRLLLEKKKNIKWVRFIEEFSADSVIESGQGPLLEDP